jgi:SAM-dependent methyltransferase
MTDPVKGRHRAMWSLGDYTQVAPLTAEMGRDLVAAGEIGPGMRVLDVAAGTGNASLPAAEAGAEVVATDFVPGLLIEGERLAAGLGLTLRWIEADAENLPFADGEFDVVMSCIGAMFAPDHAATAGELLRVCRPGGTLLLANWTAAGAVGRLFRVLGRYAPPPPPGAIPPTAWGDPGYLLELFGGRVRNLRTSVRTIPLAFTGSPAEARDHYRVNFGPVIATFASLTDDPERSAALDRDLLDFLTELNSGPAGGPARYDFEYLLVTGSA